jgi:hypothetical protein
VLFLWIGLHVSPDWLQQVFGISTIGHVDIEMVRLSTNVVINGGHDTLFRTILVRQGRSSWSQQFTWSFVHDALFWLYCFFYFSLNLQCILLFCLLRLRWLYLHFTGLCSHTNTTQYKLYLTWCKALRYVLACLHAGFSIQPRPPFLFDSDPCMSILKFIQVGLSCNPLNLFSCRRHYLSWILPCQSVFEILSLKYRTSDIDIWRYVDWYSGIRRAPHRNRRGTGSIPARGPTVSQLLLIRSSKCINLIICTVKMCAHNVYRSVVTWGM